MANASHEEGTWASPPSRKSPLECRLKRTQQLLDPPPMQKGSDEDSIVKC